MPVSTSKLIPRKCFGLLNHKFVSGVCLKFCELVWSRIEFEFSVLGTEAGCTKTDNLVRSLICCQLIYI